MSNLVIVRHGESQWNQENRFTGWVDVDLSERGMQEAIAAGKALRGKGWLFDLTYTSVLKRAIRTHWMILDQMDTLWLPVTRSWRLNERHYGALQGLNKAETAQKHGDEQVKIWRRSFDTPPPPLDPASPMNPRKDPRYASLKDSEIPLCESLKDTIARTIPLWSETIAPEIRAGKSVLIVAHGNSLRGLVKHLKRISDQDIMELNIPTGNPWVFELDSDLQVKNDYYLMTQS